MVLYGMFRTMADEAPIPVTLHLDHCPEREWATKCLATGWNSVLFDGSHLDMDGALIGSINISINKAYTAIAFQIQTKDLVDVTQPGQPLFGLSTARKGSWQTRPERRQLAS